MDIKVGGPTVGAPVLSADNPLQKSIAGLRELQSYFRSISKDSVEDIKPPSMQPTEFADCIEVVLVELGKHEHVAPTLTVVDSIKV